MTKPTYEIKSGCLVLAPLRVKQVRGLLTAGLLDTYSNNKGAIADGAALVSRFMGVYNKVDTFKAWNSKESAEHEYAVAAIDPIDSAFLDYLTRRAATFGIKANAREIANPQWLKNEFQKDQTSRGYYIFPIHVATNDGSIVLNGATIQNIADAIVKSDGKVPAFQDEIDRANAKITKKLGDKLMSRDEVDDLEVVSVEPLTKDDVADYGIYTPNAVPVYTPFGNAERVRTILGSGVFFPIYVTGLSGNGKTFMIEQECARLGREVMRVNVTALTDEDDLVGHYQLVNGDTKWQYGPVAEAMRRGAVLLLDEVDLGTNKMMCLQPVLEGNPLFIKKLNEKIEPAPGFTIVATANTKGRGDMSGMFSGTNMLNEAFLERFAATIEQEYPDKKIEKEILEKTLGEMVVGELQGPDNIFIENLVKFANAAREGFDNGDFDAVITTRRLVHMLKLYSMFNRDEKYAIHTGLARFTIEDQEIFKDLYDKLALPLWKEDVGEEIDTTVNKKAEDVLDMLDDDWN